MSSSDLSVSDTNKNNQYRGSTNSDEKKKYNTLIVGVLL